MVKITEIRGDARKGQLVRVGPKKPKRSMALTIAPRMPSARFHERKMALNQELAAYGAACINPLAPVRARVPDNNNSLTTAFQSVTIYSTTATNGYINVVFNPKSLSQHYGVWNATDDLKVPVVAATNYNAYSTIYASMRVVSAGLYVLPNVALSERPGRSYCVANPRGAGIPTPAVMKTMQDAGPHDIRDGCFFRWSKSDHEDDQFLGIDNLNTDGPLVLFCLEAASTTAIYSIKLVVNYEATVRPSYQGVIRTTPSPRFPEERSKIDSKVASLPVDASVKQMSTGGPTPQAASIASTLSSIANGVSTVSDSVLGKGNIVGRAAGWIGSAISKVGSWFGL